MTTAKKGAEVQKISAEQMELLNSPESDALSKLGHLFEHFEQKDSAEMKSLTAEYLEMKEDTSYNFIFTGMTTFTVLSQKTGEPEIREAAMLVNKEGRSYINGGAVLINACKRIEKTPAFIRITTGKKVNSGSGDGKYLQMEVKTV